MKLRADAAAAINPRSNRPAPRCRSRPAGARLPAMQRDRRSAQGRPTRSAPPQGGLGDGDEGQHLRLAQEAGVRQRGAGRRGRGIRRRGGGNRNAGHERPLIGMQPAKVMTCSATTALGQETRQPPGNARLLDHRGRSVRAVDEDASRRGPLPRALFGVIRSPPPRGCMPAAMRCGSARSMPRRAESGTGCVRSPRRARRVRRTWPARRRQRADDGRGRYRLRRHPMRVEARGDSPVERVIGATVAPTCLCGQPMAWTHGSVRTAHGQHARADCPRKRR